MAFSKLIFDRINNLQKIYLLQKEDEFNFEKDKKLKSFSPIIQNLNLADYLEDYFYNKGFINERHSTKYDSDTVNILAFIANRFLEYKVFQNITDIHIFFWKYET